MMGGYGSGMGWTWMFWLPLIVGVLLLAGLGIWYFSADGHRGGPTGSPDSRGAWPAGSGGTPREILDERFARGELTAEEYQERLKSSRARADAACPPTHCPHSGGAGTAATLTGAAGLLWGSGAAGKQ